MMIGRRKKKDTNNQKPGFQPQYPSQSYQYPQNPPHYQQPGFQPQHSQNPSQPYQYPQNPSPRSQAFIPQQYPLDDPRSSGSFPFHQYGQDQAAGSQNAHSQNRSDGRNGTIGTTVKTVVESFKPKPLSKKQKFLLTLFFLEVLIYPFIIAYELGEPISQDPESSFIRTGIRIMFIWVPITLVIGYLLGRRMYENPDVIRFFRENDVTPDEVPPVIGIFAPLAVITAVLMVWLAGVLLQIWIITIPLYLIYRFWKKKGIRSFLKWIYRKVLRLAIRMKRLSYIGYILPIFFGAIFSRGITKNAQTNAGGTYLLILIQMVVLLGLWKHIRSPPAGLAESPKEGK